MFFYVGQRFFASVIHKNKTPACAHTCSATDRHQSSAENLTHLQRLLTFSLLAGQYFAQIVLCDRKGLARNIAQIGDIISHISGTSGGTAYRAHFKSSRNKNGRYAVLDQKVWQDTESHWSEHGRVVRPEYSAFHHLQSSWRLKCHCRVMLAWERWRECLVPFYLLSSEWESILK